MPEAKLTATCEKPRWCTQAHTHGTGTRLKSYGKLDSKKQPHALWGGKENSVRYKFSMMPSCSKLWKSGPQTILVAEVKAELTLLGRGQIYSQGDSQVPCHGVLAGLHKRGASSPYICCAPRQPALIPGCSKAGVLHIQLSGENI